MMVEPDQNKNLKSEDNLLRLVILNPPDKGHEALRSMFTQIPYVWLQAECTKYEFLQEVIANQTEPHVVVIAIDADLEKACAAIEKLADNMPGVGILAISKRDDGQAILKALRAGAKEFLTMPFDVDVLANTLNKLKKMGGSTENTPKPGISKKEKTITVSFLGSRGGVGCTSLSVNLAATLAADPSNGSRRVASDAGRARWCQTRSDTAAPGWQRPECPGPVTRASTVSGRDGRAKSRPRTSARPTPCRALLREYLASTHAESGCGWPWSRRSRRRVFWRREIRAPGNHGNA